MSSEDVLQNVSTLASYNVLLQVKKLSQFSHQKSLHLCFTVHTATDCFTGCYGCCFR